MEALNDFEIKVPFVCFDIKGRIPVKGHTFYICYNNTYYMVEIDKIGVVNKKYDLSCYNGIEPCPAIWFHSATDSFCAIFVKNYKRDSVCADVINTKTNKHVHNVPFYEYKESIYEHTPISFNICECAVSFNGLPFENMKRAAYGLGAIYGDCYFLNSKKQCEFRRVIVNRFSITMEKGKWVAKDIKFNSILGEEIKNLNKFFASKKDVEECINSTIKIVDLPKQEKKLDLHIEISENDDMKMSLYNIEKIVRDWFYDLGK